MKNTGLKVIESNQYATFKGRRIWPTKHMDYRKLGVIPRMRPKRKLMPVCWVGKDRLIHDSTGYHAHPMTIRKIKD